MSVTDASVTDAALNALANPEGNSAGLSATKCVTPPTRETTFRPLSDRSLKYSSEEFSVRPHPECENAMPDEIEPTDQPVLIAADV